MKNEGIVQKLALLAFFQCLCAERAACVRSVRLGWGSEQRRLAGGQARAAGAACMKRLALPEAPEYNRALMEKSRAQEYMQKFGDQSIRFTPFALKKTGLVPSQVFLKIEDYLLICAPFQLSMKRGIFLVVLSAQEISFSSSSRRSSARSTSRSSRPAARNR